MPGGRFLAIKTINPYLFFNGQASDAIAFYEKALDARIVRVARFSDMPDSGVPPEHVNSVMHAELEAGATLLLADAVRGPAVERGGNFAVCLQYQGPTDVDRHFAALSEGGAVVEPLQDTFWGARFGMLVDKFGIHWMFNATLTE
jgi:PhnB protein